MAAEKEKEKESPKIAKSRENEIYFLSTTGNVHPPARPREVNRRKRETQITSPRRGRRIETSR